MTEASLWDRPNARWNVTWLVLDGLVFALGYNFLSPISILPVFVTRLTPIDTLAGSFVAIDQLGIALPQFFATRWATRAARQGRRKWLKAWVNLAGRLPLAAAIVVLLYFGDSEPGVVVAVVMVAFGLFRLFEGMGVPAYYDGSGRSSTQTIGPDTLRGIRRVPRSGASPVGSVRDGYWDDCHFRGTSEQASLSVFSLQLS